MKVFVKLNSEDYEYQVHLFNARDQIVLLNSQKIKSLLITDNILEPFLNQTMILSDENEGLFKSRYSDGTNETQEDDNMYTFIGNGLDAVHIKIKPVLETRSLYNTENEYDDVFTIEETFIVKEIEDTIVDNRNKVKILTLQQVDEFTLRRKNSTFGTGVFGNSDKREYSGLALRRCVEDVLPEQKFADWDVGGNRVFHLASKDESYMDTISEILQKSISVDNDAMIFRKGRGKSFYLRSLKNFFKHAIDDNRDGGLLFDNTYLISEPDQMTKKRTEAYVPLLQNVLIHQYNIIDGLEITPKDWGTSYKNFRSMVVNGYDNGSSTFKIHQFPIEKTVDQFKTNYVDSFSKLGRATANIDISEEMKKGNAVYIDLSVYGDDETIQQKGNKQELLEMIMFNDVVKFKLKGLTNRKQGTFIELRRGDVSIDNDFNRRYIGIHLVLAVEHIFNGEVYETIMTTTKTYQAAK